MLEAKIPSMNFPLLLCVYQCCPDPTEQFRCFNQLNLIKKKLCNRMGNEMTNVTLTILAKYFSTLLSFYLCGLKLLHSCIILHLQGSLLIMIFNYLQCKMNKSISEMRTLPTQIQLSLDDRQHDLG